MLLKCSAFTENRLISYLGKLKWGGTGGEVGRELLGGLFSYHWWLDTFVGSTSSLCSFCDAPSLCCLAEAMLPWFCYSHLAAIKHWEYRNSSLSAFWKAGLAEQTGVLFNNIVVLLVLKYEYNPFTEVFKWDKSNTRFFICYSILKRVIVSASSVIRYSLS